MGKMLHNEARELLVESYEKTHNAEEIAKIFGVNKYTVYHCLKPSPVRFCVSVNGIASAGLRLMNIARNLGNCYKLAIAVTVVGVCVVLPALAPAFMSAVAALSAKGAALASIGATILSGLRYLPA